MTDDVATPEISVVILTRDRRHRLPRTLESALAQEGVDLEVVVVDNGSRDQTAAYLRSHADPRLTTLTNPSPAGLGAARNAGIIHARAPWIALLDDDDLWSPNKLRMQLNAANAANARWVYSSVIGVNDSLRPLYMDPGPSPDSLLERLLTTNVLGGRSSNICARRDLVSQVGAFDEQLSHLADWELWIRLAAVETPVRVASVLTAYVHHSESMVLGRARELEAELDYIEQKHRCLRSRYPGSAVDRAGIIKWAAWSHSLLGQRREALSLYLSSAIRHRRIDFFAALSLLVPRRRLYEDPPNAPPPPSWLSPA